MAIQGKRFVVTGGGSGIGREVVLTLLRRQARVAALDLRPSGLQETTERAGDLAGSLSGHVVDVSDPTALADTVEEVVAAGEVDGVLNVAGIIQRFAPVAELSEAEMQKVIGDDARMLDRLSRLAPQRATDLIARKMASLVRT